MTKDQFAGWLTRDGIARPVFQDETGFYYFILENNQKVAMGMEIWRST